MARPRRRWGSRAGASRQTIRERMRLASFSRGDGFVKRDHGRGKASPLVYGKIGPSPRADKQRHHARRGVLPGHVLPPL
jgi:hypothetical protein